MVAANIFNPSLAKKIKNLNKIKNQFQDSLGYTKNCLRNKNIMEPQSFYNILYVLRTTKARKARMPVAH